MAKIFQKNFPENFGVFFQRNDNIATENSLFLFHILPKFRTQRKTLSLSSYMIPCNMIPIHN